jgi:2-polyprenyl-3-methyl-5-hydroxy-6-metoxy-1,4-benzoquinol methylase
VGCASGEFIQYLGATQPGLLKCTGLDVSDRLVSLARKRCPAASFRVADITKDEIGAAYDIITMFGVLNCLDNGTEPLGKLLSAARPKGCVLLLDFINADPIDVLTRYRRADADGVWERGWNIYSRVTLDRFLRASTAVANWSYERFQISFDLPKREDTMRTWTIAIEGNPRQLVNGACQLVNLEFLIVEMK